MKTYEDRQYIAIPREIFDCLLAIETTGGATALSPLTKCLVEYSLHGKADTSTLSAVEGAVWPFIKEKIDYGFGLWARASSGGEGKKKVKHHVEWSEIQKLWEECSGHSFSMCLKNGNSGPRRLRRINDIDEAIRKHYDIRDDEKEDEKVLAIFRKMFIAAQKSEAQKIDIDSFLRDWQSYFVC